MSVEPGLSSRLSELGTESAFSVLARARELEATGVDVIHLEIGEPDFATPRHICEAAANAIASGATHYAPAAGIPEFRAAAAEYLARTRGLPVSADDVLVGTGAKPFLLFTVLATCNPGDEVVYPDPGFPIYESVIRWAGATPVPVALAESRDFEFDPEALLAAVTPRTKLVILNSPHNPTGGVLSAETLQALGEALRERPVWVLSDEIYSQLVYDGTFASIASVPGMAERTIVLDGLSKAYAMTGWRCGFAAVPKPLIEPLTRFFVNSTSCVPPFVQAAGVAALTGPQDEVHAMLAEFRARRELVSAGLNELPGVTCRIPRGAFYAFPNVSGLPVPAGELADRLLVEAGVATLDGGSFGVGGAGHLRISYANSQARLREALTRIGAFVDSLSPR